MQMPDVNVLVYAFRQDAPDHERYHRWLHQLVNGDEAFALSELVISGFLRVVTHPRVFDPPEALPEALNFVETLQGTPRARLLRPGPRHWDIFARLCRQTTARGNLVPDAYHAALAIERGCEWISTDRDFRRFNGLRWRHPLD